MAFSFRVGTNWCHDFPKLARESGFFFNMHTARVRVDWNRISNIDIDRLIRERDFQTIDENINYVIDYCLESEYDVKILDPNFVKLFRLAQLAVEYFLYCKQYLDQSVVILKEELRFKLEENVKLKEDLRSHQNIIRELKEKSKEKKNSSEVVNTESQGQIHKCPCCPKTFSTAQYANAHLKRRHQNVEVLTASPVREEYRAETDKLHNEIKSLKERLNQTERIVRSDSSKLLSPFQENKSVNVPEAAGDSMLDDHYRKYHEDMSNLKTSICTEIRNIKRKEPTPTHQESEVINENIKEVISQQESEIQRLRSQLQENLASNANEVESKLVKQEEFWKLKIDQLEGQHRKDIDNLFAQLKLTQESAVRMKTDYEDKVTFLEKQSIEQSKLLSAQTEQLNSITRGMMMQDYQAKAERESNLSKKLIRQHSEYDSETSQKKSKEPKQFLSSFKSKLVATKKPEDKKVEKVKGATKYSSLDESEKSESTLTETETETDEDETTESEASRTESTNDEVPPKEDRALKSESHKKRRSSLDYQNDIKEEILKDFERKLRDLGIDPEWNGIPIITYKQKMEGVKHHQNIAAKMFPKYEQIRKKILEEIAKKLSSTNQKSLIKDKDVERKSLFNKTVKNVKTKAMRAISEFKAQKGGNETSSVASSRNSSPKDYNPRRKFSFELLPKKPTQQDIQDIKRQTRQHEIEKKVDKPTAKKEDSPKISGGKPVTTEAVIEAPKRLQRSYLTIEDFMKDITETTVGAKITSTPSKNVHQDTDSEGQLTKQDWALSSPKNSKSMLKSTANASGSVKKKVLFDLEKDTDSEKQSRVTEYLDDYDGQKELNDSDWNTSSTMSEEKEKISPKEKTASTENIQLKTSQSEKIAEISRKIQEKLDASRRKPAGSIEAMFSAKTVSATDKEEVEALKNRESTDRLSTILESVSSQSGSKSRSTDQLPKPAPRRQLLFETKDLDKDIDDLLTNYR